MTNSSATKKTNSKCKRCLAKKPPHPPANIQFSIFAFPTDSVRNIDYSPNLTRYEVSSNITCSALGNPLPYFEWINSLCEECPIKNGNLLIISKEMLGQNKWSCRAQNIIDDEPFEELIKATFEVVLDNDGQATESPDSIRNQIYLIMAVSFIITFVVGTCLLLLHVRRSRKNRKPLESENGYDSSDEKASLCLELVYKLTEEDDLNAHGKEISKLLASDGKIILTRYPKMFSDMIEKASSLIPFPLYREIIQSMTVIYSKNKEEFVEGPLQCLRQLLSDNNVAMNLFKHQENTLSLMKTMILADDCDQQRTKLLLTLITLAEYTSESPCPLKWTVTFISTLKILLENGADPTWITEDWQTLEEHARCSAQHKFFRVIKKVLVHEKCDFEQLKCVYKLFLRAKLYNERIQGTALHALVDMDWKWLIEVLDHPPDSFFWHYKDMINCAVQHEPDATDKVDSYGRTPLQTFIHCLRLREECLQDILDIVKLLKSETNVNSRDHTGQTVLHTFAEAFPVFHKSTAQQMQEALEEIPTSQHWCRISENHQNIFCQLVMSLVTELNANLQDERKCTPLHIVSKKIFFDTHLGHYLLPIVHLLTTSTNVNIPDRDSMTPYSWVLGGKIRLQQGDCDLFRTFSSIEEIFVEKGADHGLAMTGVKKIRKC